MPESNGSVQLDGTTLFASFRDDGLLVPAFVTGRLSDVPAGTRIAVTVNGRIAATSYSYDAGGEVRLGAMVPPAVFRNGTNRVRLYTVVGDSRATRLLQPISGANGADANAQLSERDGDGMIELTDGSAVSVVAGAATGHVDRVRAEAGSIEVIGWATDPGHRRVADEVLVFADGRLIARGQPDLPRPDVAGHFEQQGITASGFRLIGAIGRATELATPEHLRVLAVVDGKASDLPLEEPVFQVR